jgi:AraC family transcriptional activator of pobA
MKSKKPVPADIPQYPLHKFRPVHRMDEDGPDFGYNAIGKIHIIEGFELFSSEGMIREAMGPFKSEFYRISVTVSGMLDMQIGLEHFHNQARTVAFTYPNQILSKRNASPDAFGYYILFETRFLEEIVPSVKITEEFPFYDPSGVPLFQLSESEISRIIDLILRINEELQHQETGRVRAVKMYVYLILLEARRSYERQQLGQEAPVRDSNYILSQFRRLVGQHYLTKRKVNDYAGMLSITPNHLNRVIKELTGGTASDSIQEMLLQEAKALLKYTDSTISEIAYKLQFSDPSSFVRFFKSTSKQTPKDFRLMSK